MNNLFKPKDSFSFNNNNIPAHSALKPLQSCFDKMVVNERKSIGPAAKYSKNHQSTYHWVPNDESPKFKAGAMNLYTMAVEKDPFLSPVFNKSRNVFSKS